jgi:hypothetical protein
MPKYSTLPVGVKREYVVVKAMSGVVSYMADALGVIQRLSLKQADNVVTLLDAAMFEQPKFVPWPTDHLPSKKPVTMFPPARMT